MENKWKFSFLFLLPVLAVLTFWNYNNRIYDWDMPGYLGCLYTQEFPGSPQKVKDITYYAIKKEAAKAYYNDIIGMNPINKSRQAFEKSEIAFSEQLPYYSIKVGYNLLITLFYKIGFTSPMSVLLISLLSYFFSGILLFFIFKIIFPNNYIIAFFAAVGILLLPPIIEMSRISTPDMFILQFLLLFMIALFRNWSKWSVFILLFLIVFIRPDYIIFTLTYLVTTFVYLFLMSKKINLVYIFQGIILLLIYFLIVKYYNYPSWKDVFFDTFIYRRPIISAMSANVSLHKYLSILFEKFINFKKMTLIACSCLALIFYFSKDKWIRIFSGFIFINIFIKFAFFPQSAILRFFFGFIILLLIMLSFALSKKYNGFRLNKNP